MEHEYRPISMALKYPAIKFNSSPSAQRHSTVCVMAKPIPSLRVDSKRLLTTTIALSSNSQPIPSLLVDSRRSLTTTIAMLSNSQGELADILTRLRKELKQTMYLYKSACKDYQAMSATEKGELKDKLTKLIKELQQTMSAEDLYNSACKELQAMSADYLYNFACNSVTEKTKYKAGTSKGKERIEGEREDEVTVQHERKYEAGTSKGKERIKDGGEDDVTIQHEGELEDERTRLIKELQRTKDLYKSAYEKLQAKCTTEKRKYVSGTFKGKERIEGEGEDDVAAQYVRKDEAGTSKGKERIEGEGEGDVTIQHEREDEDKVTRLRKERKQMMDLYYSAYKELQAMSTKDLYCSACKESQAMSATEKDMFEEEKRSILEPSGALALAGAEAYCKYYGLKGENVVATTSGANMNFDRLRLVTKLADIGRQREAVLATYMPEEPKGAGTSKGESLKGEGEDDVTVQHEGEHEDILTRLKKVLQQAMPAPETDMFEEEKRSILEPAGALALAGAEAYCKYYGLKGENVVATTSGATMNFDRLRLVTELADVGRQREAVLATYMPEEPKGAGTSKGERLKGEGEDDVTVQHERKYEAGTSKGRELIEGEGEDDVTAQYIADAIGSVFKERLKDDDLLFSLSLPPPDFALFQRAEEREHNFARERAEEREHNFALPQMTEEREHNFALSQRAEGKENKNWFGGLGSVVPLVINVGICAATYIGVCLLYKDAGKKVDVLALRLKAVNEAWDAAGCPPPTVCVLNPSVTISSLFALFNFGNPSTTVSTPVGLFNRGNPSTTVSPLLGLININIGK